MNISKYKHHLLNIQNSPQARTGRVARQQGVTCIIAETFIYIQLNRLLIFAFTVPFPEKQMTDRYNRNVFPCLYIYTNNTV